MSQLLKKIFYILPKGDPVKLIVLLTLMLLAAVMEVVGIGTIPAFVAIVANPDRVMMIEALQPVFEAFQIKTSQDLLVFGAALLVSVFILKSAYIIAFNYFEARFVYNRRYTISHRLMSAYMRAPYIFHLQRNSAELLRNIAQEIKAFIDSVVANLLKMIREGVMALAILTFLLIVEPLITLMIITISGVGAGTFILLNKRKMKEYGQEEQELRSDMIKAVNQGLGGIKEARVLNREEEFIEKFRLKTFQSTRLLTYIRFIQQIPRPVVETTAVLGMLLVAVILVWQDRLMADIIPILTLFAMATVRLMPSVQQIVALYTNLQYNIVSVDPIYEDLKALQDSEDKFVEERKKATPLVFEKHIAIKNVNYRYPNSDEQALRNISITIPKNKAVAFVGSSGAGKTTMVDVILGLLNPQKGEVLVDGINISENRSAWQQNIGYIPQSIYIADETLRANIAFGVREKDIDDKKVMNAVRLAQLEHIVNRLPKGLDTLVGEHGTRLSGGQRQRVGIARALYHDPKVLVMDEATSALDNITERQITTAIESLKGERTLIIIAHRLSTVKKCDRLYFMEDGEVIQEGTYLDLVESNHRFREMALES